ncbi:TetR/AcrR family transcriptional regulator [Microtetraspora niveoalba]|uniref:TetR/AcrR family transcriptional regulator n=1 Tax=Microtetraspora niveoalba TaxID=46175 RepID=UPI00083489E0|nr:TetR/AcrR family transcriptional regulator [Microtetraspora niveoalba]
MPKQVDHAARRAEIARAALRLCARDGLAGVSIGQVAQEAGVSKGLVQHYFAGKADLLRASAHVLREEIARHVSEAVRDADGPRETLRLVLLAIVELGAHAPVLLLAGHAFLARTVADPEVRDLYRTGGDAVHRDIAALVAAAGPAPGVDPGAEAHALLGLARGLADGVLVGELAVEEAAAVLDHHLGRIHAEPGRAPSPDVPA